MIYIHVNYSTHQAIGVKYIYLNLIFTLEGEHLESTIIIFTLFTKIKLEILTHMLPVILNIDPRFGGNYFLA